MFIIFIYKYFKMGTEEGQESAIPQEGGRLATLKKQLLKLAMTRVGMGEESSDGDEPEWDGEMNIGIGTYRWSSKWVYQLEMSRSTIDFTVSGPPKKEEEAEVTQISGGGEDGEDSEEPPVLVSEAAADDKKKKIAKGKALVQVVRKDGVCSQMEIDAKKNVAFDLLKVVRVSLLLMMLNRFQGAYRGNEEEGTE